MRLYVHLSNSFLLNAMLIKVSDALQKQITIWIPYDNQSTLIYLMPNMHHLSIFRHLRKYCIAHDFKTVTKIQSILFTKYKPFACTGFQTPRDASLVSTPRMGICFSAFISIQFLFREGMWWCSTNKRKHNADLRTVFQNFFWTGLKRSTWHWNLNKYQRAESSHRWSQEKVSVKISTRFLIWFFVNLCSYIYVSFPNAFVK